MDSHTWYLHSIVHRIHDGEGWCDMVYGERRARLARCKAILYYTAWLRHRTPGLHAAYRGAVRNAIYWTVYIPTGEVIQFR